MLSSEQQGEKHVAALLRFMDDWNFDFYHGDQRVVKAARRWLKKQLADARDSRSTKKERRNEVCCEVHPDHSGHPS